MKEIYISSVPRSGNTWLCRMLGDALDSPLVAKGRKGKDIPEYFGKGRDGEYWIRKTHDEARYGTTIFIYRDPRDVAVSRLFYRGSRPEDTTLKLKAVINTMVHYEDRVRWWLSGKEYDVITSYERLHKFQAAELDRIIREVAKTEISSDRLKEVFKYQSIKNIKERYGDRFRGSIRKGIVGDWKNHFTREHGEMITGKLGDLMMEQGYISDLKWWKEIDAKSN